MPLILGIETSCDETGVAVFDSEKNIIRSNALFSQIQSHAKFGGVVPEIASRSQLEKINSVTQEALTQAQVTLQEIDTIAVTNRPGLIGSLLVGICFAKGMAWAAQKKIIGIDHLEGHIFSAFLKDDSSVAHDIPFPHLSITASGGHTALYLVHDFGSYQRLVETDDDAAGEAFDKIAKSLGFGYPGGALIERLAQRVEFKDFFNFPRTKNEHGRLFFSFSGLKTAVLYTLVREGVYDLEKGPILDKMTSTLQERVASSLLVCIADIFEKNVLLAFKQHPSIKALTFGGGVACNAYIRDRLRRACNKLGKSFHHPPPAFCTDNGSMIAFVGAYKAKQGLYSDFTLDANR